MAADGGGVIDVSPWLKSMPLAPEYHPTMAEFVDPISYIFKIEKEASKYGICKIVPPVPSAPRKTVVANFNKSLVARPNGADSGPTFTTRQQQIGFCPRKHRPVQKSVWQSGLRYTLTEFETKARNFERNYLKKYSKKTLNAMDIETLYWNAMADKTFQVEYANDMPGSAFVTGNKRNDSAASVGETDWNMRRVSRENLSLLRFMKEEIPGVTSPMVYVAMMFSWFAWHVEDHDLHSMNYLHMGSAKTWYGVPREAAVAFEEVIREHGYGGEINPLVTFSTLGEKTTVMSPEVLISAGVPCCRLVQNAGEFVVTFPRAYHSGFSHGFNCGEAANIATPEWLRVAKEAAIRRAAINCPPMVSHFQLLYDLALSLCARISTGTANEPRSSRLKDRKKGEGEMFIKDLFFQDMMQNNEMLHILGKGSSVVLLPQNSLSRPFCSNSTARYQLNSKSRLFPSLCSPDLELKSTSSNAPDESKLNRKQGIKQAKGSAVNSRTFSSLFDSIDAPPQEEQSDPELKKISQCERGLFSCVACGILCFSCVAIVQPTEEASQYLMSADGTTLSNWEESDIDIDHMRDAKALLNLCSGNQCISPVDEGVGLASDFTSQKESSSLGLLALAYGNSSDSDEETEAYIPDKTEDRHSSDNSETQNFGMEANHSSIIKSNHLTNKFRQQKNLQIERSNFLPHEAEVDASTMPFVSRSNEDSSQLHVFCLQHAMQVENRLSQVGGAHVFLVCHPDYPKLESQAKKVAEELESKDVWNEISFCDATDKDEEIIRLALESEKAVHGNRDWAVKLGINLFYSANLSRSPLYSKQMHYNFIIYSAFGRSSSDSSETSAEVEGRVGFGRQKKITVAGKWCGKVWMSNQAHPLLVNKDLREEQVKRPLEGRKTIRKRKYNAESISYKEKIMEAEKLVEPCADVSLSRCKNKVKRKDGIRRFEEENSDVEINEELSEELVPSDSCGKVKSERGSRRPDKEEEISEDLSDKLPLRESWKQIWSKQVKRNQRSRNSLMEEEEQEEDETDGGPSTRLRKRQKKACSKESASKSSKVKTSPVKKKNMTKKKLPKIKVEEEEIGEYACEMEGCTMSFDTKQELATHKRNICPVKGCGKKFFSHKYLVQHRRVHMDDRPLKCPWKGCKMTFKWAWARTEHIRVHTGARPYVCTEAGCGQTFRFVSDFSRHKRKTGHAPKKGRGT